MSDAVKYNAHQLSVNQLQSSGTCSARVYWKPRYTRALVCCYCKRCTILGSVITQWKSPCLLESACLINEYQDIDLYPSLNYL